jgi:hypothetical protein
LTQAEDAMGLVAAAGLATVLALAALGGLARSLAASDDRRALLWALALALPLQPLAFYAVRLPLLHALLPDAGTGWLRPAFLLSLAPLTEEPAKWLILAVPRVRAALAKRTVVPLALAGGLGFGIGEIWFVAHAAMTAPGFVDHPFWIYGGFVVERLQVCFLHAVFLALPLAMLAWQRSFVLGGIAAMAMHFLLNLPIYLATIDLLGLGRAAWATVLLLWVPLCVTLGALLLWRLWKAGRRATAAAVPAGAA